jgi:hypothetical protein
MLWSEQGWLVNMHFIDGLQRIPASPSTNAVPNLTFALQAPATVTDMEMDNTTRSQARRSTKARISFKTPRKNLRAVTCTNGSVGTASTLDR